MASSNDERNDENAEFRPSLCHGKNAGFNMIEEALDFTGVFYDLHKHWLPIFE